MKAEDTIAKLQKLDPATDIIFIMITKEDFDEENDEAANEGYEYGHVHPPEVSLEEWARIVSNYEMHDWGQVRAHEDIYEFIFHHPLEESTT